MSSLLSPLDFTYKRVKRHSICREEKRWAIKTGPPQRWSHCRARGCLTPGPPLPLSQTFSRCVFPEVALPCLPPASNCSFHLLGEHCRSSCSLARPVHTVSAPELCPCSIRAQTTGARLYLPFVHFLDQGNNCVLFTATGSRVDGLLMEAIFTKQMNSELWKILLTAPSLTESTPVDT